MNKMEDIFDNCIYCGQTVYTDGLGDDVIPIGYWDDSEMGWACEYCYSEEENE